jgi:uncharacterized Ntn-hydrolase superfamily protein
MVALCKKTGSLGVVTCTTGRAVGNSVPHAKEKVGAIATQHLTNIFHGTNGIRLLEIGYHPKKVLKSSLALDSRPEQRQILIVDSKGNTAAHTGEKNSEWCGDLEGPGYAIGGNILSSSKVLEEMEKSFKNTESLALHERLLLALDAGWEAGGCNAPDHTAALLVVGLEEEMKLAYRPVLNLRVDYSETATPTKDLRKIYDDYKSWVSEMRAQGSRHTVL